VFLAALLGVPGLRDTLFAALGPEDFTLPPARAIYNALFGLHLEGAAFDVHRIMARFESDAESLALLADLPEGADLPDRVSAQLQFLEQQRSDERRRRRRQEQVRAFGRGERAGGVQDPDAFSFGGEHVVDADSFGAGGGADADGPDDEERPA
jgi:hypothetical protein